MKKIVGTIAAVALIAASAFADVGIGAWGRGIWAPVAGDAKDIVTYSLPTWAWGANYQGPRVGISIHGDSENVGFNIDMNGDNGGIGAGDTQFIWVKPWSFLEVQVGKVQDNSARGDACFGAFNWLRNSTMAKYGEDFTFLRFGGRGLNDQGARQIYYDATQAKGAIVKVTPIDGLWIEALFDLKDSNDFKKVYGNRAQYGAGYKINGIGHIRAQWICEDNANMKNGDVCGQSIVNAAFDLTAVENLFVTVGGFFYLGSDLPRRTMDINLYAKYTVSIVTIHALFGMQMWGNDAKNAKGNARGMDMLIGVGADFDLGNGIAVNADFRMGINGYATEDNMVMSFMAGVSKGFSNGLIGIAFEGMTDESRSFFYNAEELAKKGNAFAWQLPVRVEYWF